MQVKKCPTHVRPLVAIACVVTALIFGVVAGVTPLAISVSDERGPTDVVKTLDLLHSCTFRQDSDGDRSVAACIPLGHHDAGCFERAVRARVQQGLTAVMGLALFALCFFGVVDSLVRILAPGITMTFCFSTNSWVLLLSTIAMLLAAATAAAGATLVNGEFCGIAPFNANPNTRYGPSMFCTMVSGILCAVQIGLASATRSSESDGVSNEPTAEGKALRSVFDEREPASPGTFGGVDFHDASPASSPTEPINPLL